MKKSKNLNFYKTIAAISASMTALFFLGFGLISLLDRSRDRSLVNNPIVPTQTQPSTTNQSPIAVTPTLSPSVGTAPQVVPPSSLPIVSNHRSIAYRVVQPTSFKAPSVKLKSLVQQVVKYSRDRQLPTDALSVVLIDRQTGEKADYNGSVYRYPASVVKMFWLVAIYQKIANGEVPETSLTRAIEDMVRISDNNGASKIVDTLTQTKSTRSKLTTKDFEIQKQQRQNLNEFFQQAGYSKNFNISQKTFPIPAENAIEPIGFDQQLRGVDSRSPTRNRVTANDAARLMYEIVTDRAVSPVFSHKMQKLLSREIDPKSWRKIPAEDFNLVESFFGEGLIVDRTDNIISKAGWTPMSRQEVAFIKSKDGKTKYILAIFGDAPAYGNNKKIFPDIAKLVDREMQKRSTK